MYTRARFSLFEPAPEKIDFRINVGPVLRAQSSTILTLGGPWADFACHMRRCFCEVIFDVVPRAIRTSKEGGDDE